MKQTQAVRTEAGPARPQFMIGKDSRGHWVVQDESGLRGGLFVSRTEALHFAMFETGNRPQAVIMVPGVLELNLGRRPPQARLLHAPAARRT